MSDDIFMKAAFKASNRSDDLHTKVGAVILCESLDTCTANNFYVGDDSKKQERQDRPLKYAFTTHAEEGAIMGSFRMGHDLKDGKMFVTHIPCPTCARLIAQSGIARVVCAMQRTSTSDVDEPITRSILSECGVEFVEYEKPLD